MNEKELYKKLIEEKVIQKDKIKNNVILNSTNKERKSEFMKKRVLIPIVASIVCIVVISVSYVKVENYEYNQANTFLANMGITTSRLSREDTKKVYNDIKSNTFKYEITKEVLTNKATELGISLDPKKVTVKQIYESINTYDYSTDVKKVTSEKIKEIKKGTKYKDIVSFLGQTRHVGSGAYILKYLVDNNKYLYLSFLNENNICDKSGEELLNTLVNE